MTPAQPPKDGIAAPLIRAAVALGLIAAGCAAWLALAPMSSAVLAPGRFVVLGEVKTVQHLDGGIVRALHVADGDRIEAGAPLLTLDATEAEAARASLLAERDMLWARQQRLRAELASSPTLEFTDVPTPVSDSLASAMAGQLALFEARQRERVTEREAMEGALTRLAARMESLRAQQAGIQSQRTLVNEDTEAARELARTGLVTRVSLNARQRELAALDGRDSALAADLSETSASQAEARLGYAQSQSSQISAISRELAEATAGLVEIAPRIRTEEERIARATLRAPVSGIVSGLGIATIGGVIAPGEPILEVVPTEGRLVAEAALAPAARERLRLGMEAQLRLAGVRAQDEAPMLGQITLISANLDDRRDSGDGQPSDPTYRMRVSFDSVPDGVVLEPGMPVTAIVATEARTALEYLVSPLSDAMARSMREQ